MLEKIDKEAVIRTMCKMKGKIWSLAFVCWTHYRLLIQYLDAQHLSVGNSLSLSLLSLSLSLSLSLFDKKEWKDQGVR